MATVSIHNLRTVAIGSTSLPQVTFTPLVYLTFTYGCTPLVPEVEILFVQRSLAQDLPLSARAMYSMSVAAPLLVPARGSSLRWLFDSRWVWTLTSTHMYDTFSTYLHVPGSVSIHNLHTVAPHYREILSYSDDLGGA
jgi:hypothetical protein